MMKGVIFLCTTTGALLLTLVPAVSQESAPAEGATGIVESTGAADIGGLLITVDPGETLPITVSTPGGDPTPETEPEVSAHGVASFRPEGLEGWKQPELGQIDPDAFMMAMLAAQATGDGLTAANISNPLPPVDETPLADFAAGLRSNPMLIWRAIRDKFDFSPYFGSAKGPTRTLFDRAGSDLDLCLLLADLLRRCGPDVTDVQILYGKMSIPVSDMAAWLRVAPNVAAINAALVGSATPGSYVSASSRFEVIRFWVTASVQEEGNTLSCSFDPGFKRYMYAPRVVSISELGQRTGYHYSGMVGSAMVASSTTPSVLTGLNVDSLREYLGQRRDNFEASFAAGTMPSEAKAALGGWSLMPPPLVPFPVAPPVQLEFPVSGVVVLSDVSILNHRIEIAHPSFTRQLSCSEVAARQMSLGVTGARFVAEPWPVKGQRGTATLAAPILSLPSAADPRAQESFWWASQAKIPAESLGLDRNFGKWPAYDYETQVLVGTIPDGAGGGKPFLADANGNQISGGPLRLMADGSTRDYYATFNPLGITRGSYSARVFQRQIWPPPSQPTTNNTGYTVRGSVTETAKFRFRPSWTGIERWVGEPYRMTMAVFNDGVLPIEIDAGYALENNQSAAFRFDSPAVFKVQGGVNPIFAVVFDPIGPGTFSCDLRFRVWRDTVRYSALGNVPWTTRLEAKSYRRISATGLGYHFGVVQSRNSAERVSGSCSFTNSSTFPVTVMKVEVLGDVEFKSGLAVGTVVPANGSIDVPVTYRPTAFGGHAADVRIELAADGRRGWYMRFPLRGIGVEVGKAQLKVDGQIVEGGDGSVLVNDLNRVFVAVKAIPPPILNYVFKVVNGALAPKAPHEPISSPAPVAMLTSEHSYKTLRTGTYVIPLDFGDSDGGGFLAEVGRRLDATKDLPAGTSSQATARSQALLRGTLEMMGHSWFRQTNQASHFLERLFDQRQIYLHRVGLVAQEYDLDGSPAGYYIDIANQIAPSYDVLTGGSGNELFEALSLLESALEHGVLEQMQVGSVAASTSRMIERALRASNSAAPVHIHKLNYNDFSSKRSSFRNYDSDTLDSYQSSLSRNPLSWILIPSNGKIAVSSATGSWRGYGAIVRHIEGSSSSVEMLISGGYNGGFSAGQAVASVDYPLMLNATEALQNRATTFQMASPEPINLVTGDYYYDHTDLTIGSSPPLGVSFARHYNSASARTQDELGFGWSHSWDADIVALTDSGMAFGDRHCVDACTAIVAGVILQDMARLQASDAASWVIRAIISNWCIDSLKKNSVKVRIGNKVLFYSNHSNGNGNGASEFHPPPGVTDTLKKTGTNAYTLTSRDGSVSTFGSVGSGTAARSALKQVSNPDSLDINVTYDTSFRVDRVTDASGRGIDFTYTGGLITKVTTLGDTSARSVSYTYDAEKNLVSFTDAEGKPITYQYAEPRRHFMTSLKDGKGRIIAENEYNSRGQAVKQRAYGDPAQTWNFHYSDLWTFQIDPKGGVTTLYFDGQKRTIGHRDEVGNLTRTEYDFNNQTTKTIDAENREVIFTYDAFLRPTGVLYPDGTSSSQTYDARHRPLVSTSRGGKVTENEYLTSNLRFRPDKVHFYEAPGIKRTTSYTYHSAGLKIGQPSTVTDPLGRVTTIDYDAKGQPASVSRQVEVDNGAGGTSLVTVTARTLYDARGDLYETVNERGSHTRITYNKRRDKVTVVSDFGGPASYTTTTVYDEAGDAVRSYDSMPQPYKSGQTFSAQRKPLRTYVVAADGMFDDSLTKDMFYSETIYDERDWAVSTVSRIPSPLRNARAAVTTVPFANGRPHTVTDPLGRTLTHASSPAQSVSSVTDHLGFRVVTSTNPVTRQKVVSDAFASAGFADPLALPGTADKITYQLQPDGELATLTNRLNNSYNMFYDGLGRLQTQQTPSNRQTGYTYNADGSVVSVTRPDNSTVTHTYYPKSGKLRTTTDSIGTLEHFYDAAGNLTAVTDGTITLRSTYDALGRITSYKDSGGQITVYHYYQNGLLRQITYRAESAQNAIAVAYTYHADRSLKSVTDWEGRTTSFSYYQNGSLQAIYRHNGTKRSFTYTAASELQSVAELKPDGGLVFYCQFSYNQRGQLEKRQMYPPEPADATRSAAMSAVPNADNQLATVNGAGQTHDLRGNMTYGRKPDGSGQADYQFDARNRLTALTGSASYLYDLSNSRIRVTEGSSITDFGMAPLGGMSQVLTESRTGGVERAFVYTPNGQLLYEVQTSTVLPPRTETDEETGETVTIPGGSPARVYHFDLTGSTVALSNDDGEVIGRLFYTPYGEVMKRTGNTDTRFLFCGAYGVQTDASGLIHMRARYYNPHLCRFINEDPIGMDGGMNLYAYVNGLPMIANDPDGEFINFIVGAVVNVVVGGAIRAATGGEFFDGKAMAMDAAVGFATSGLGTFVRAGVAASRVARTANIVGTAQRSTYLHRAIINEKALRLAKEAEVVFLNRAINTSSGSIYAAAGSMATRPDLIARYSDDAWRFVEVASRGDKVADLMSKMNEARSTFSAIMFGLERRAIDVSAEVVPSFLGMAGGPASLTFGVGMGTAAATVLDGAIYGSTGGRPFK